MSVNNAQKLKEAFNMSINNCRIASLDEAKQVAERGGCLALDIGQSLEIVTPDQFKGWMTRAGKEDIPILIDAGRIYRAYMSPN